MYAEFRIYGIPHFYGIPYVTEYRIFTEFLGIRVRIAEFRIPSIRNFYGIPPEFRIPYH